MLVVVLAICGLALLQQIPVQPGLVVAVQVKTFRVAQTVQQTQAVVAEPDQVLVVLEWLFFVIQTTIRRRHLQQAAQPLLLLAATEFINSPPLAQ
jgi:hypothetical protein